MRRPALCSLQGQFAAGAAVAGGAGAGKQVGRRVFIRLRAGPAPGDGRRPAVLGAAAAATRAGGGRTCILGSLPTPSGRDCEGAMLSHDLRCHVLSFLAPMHLDAAAAACSRWRRAGGSAPAADRQLLPAACLLSSPPLTCPLCWARRREMGAGWSRKGEPAGSAQLDAGHRRLGGPQQDLRLAGRQPSSQRSSSSGPRGKAGGAGAGQSAAAARGDALQHAGAKDTEGIRSMAGVGSTG